MILAASLLYILPALSDVGSTMAFRSHGIAEANGMMRNPAVYLASKGAVTFAAARLDASLTHHKAQRAILRGFWLLGHAYILQRNLRALGARPNDLAK